MNAPYRIYVLVNGLPHEVASCEGDSLAFALHTLNEEHQIEPWDTVGILYRHDEDSIGTWLINPYSRRPVVV